MKATKENTKILVNEAGELEIFGDYINVVISPVEYVGYTIDSYINGDGNIDYISVYLHLCSNTIPIDVDKDLFEDLKSVTKQMFKI